VGEREGKGGGEGREKGKVVTTPRPHPSTPPAGKEKKEKEERLLASLYRQKRRSGHSKKLTHPRLGRKERENGMGAVTTTNRIESATGEETVLKPGDNATAGKGGETPTKAPGGKGGKGEKVGRQQFRAFGGGRRRNRDHAPPSHL